MSPENKNKYCAMVERVNAMSSEEVGQLIEADKCPYEPEHLRGVPLGMFHCEVCGEMVVAGLAHPRRTLPMLRPRWWFRAEYRPGPIEWLGDLLREVGWRLKRSG